MAEETSTAPALGPVGDDDGSRDGQPGSAERSRVETPCSTHGLLLNNLLDELSADRSRTPSQGSASNKRRPYPQEGWDFSAAAPEFMPHVEGQEEQGGSSCSQSRSNCSPQLGHTRSPNIGSSPSLKSPGCSPALGPIPAPSIWTMSGLETGALLGGNMLPMPAAWNIVPMNVPTTDPPPGITLPATTGGSSAPATATAGEVGTDAVSIEQAEQLRLQMQWLEDEKDVEIKRLRDRERELSERLTLLLEETQKKREDLVNRASRHAAVLSRYCIPLEEVFENAEADFAPWLAGPADGVWKDSDGYDMTATSLLGMPGAGDGEMADMSFMGLVGEYNPLDDELNQKMRRLNGLITDSATPAAVIQGDDTVGTDYMKVGGAAEYIADALQAVVPHARVKSQAEASETTALAAAAMAKAGSSHEDGESEFPPLHKGKVAVLALELQAQSKSLIDDRALQSLSALCEADAMEVLLRSQDLLKVQGGKCRNLSSILQSVVRKVERRILSKARHGESGYATIGKDVSGHLEVSASHEGWSSLEEKAAQFRAAKLARDARRRERRKAQKHGTAAGDSGSEDDSESSSTEGSEDGHAEADGMGTSGSQAARPRRGIEDISRSPVADAEDWWNVRRVERAAQRGYEWSWKNNQWELKVCMGGHQMPEEHPLSEVGLERYCRWLRTKLQYVRDENGLQALRKCCAEVDISENGLGDQALCMLLKVLESFEVHAAVLKLYKNRFTSAGVMALCEFIRTNRKAEPIYELHLSHNEIDDDAAYTLFRTLHEARPRYPPKRLDQSPPTKPVPVWIRLNENRIKKPHDMLRNIREEGITYCAARNATEPPNAGRRDYSQQDVPLLHLYLFFNQENSEALAAAPAPAASAAASSPDEGSAGHKAWGKGKKGGGKGTEVREWQPVGAQLSF
eukprot:TRINITY_DN48309_c0_g1_i2.p1 TRINITY_DN48309_c0_g1~~TRINITY_DN48309_c0_g1_i2.p1  ORF type:complete len:914 (+),score=190.67 TRINITY_DN48309_c0_g1_i2:74-2815(+)